MGGLVTDAELLLVDEGVIDAIDHQLAEVGVACPVFVLVAGDVVVEAEGLEEVLVDDIGAGGDDGVTMLLRMRSTKIFWRPAEMREPARQRMTPQSVSRSIMS